MTLPQVHYYLAKPTQHKPRQWIGSMGIKCAQALRKYININKGTWQVGIDKYNTRHYEEVSLKLFALIIDFVKAFQDFP